MSDYPELIPHNDPIDGRPVDDALDSVKARARTLRHRDRLVRAGAIVGVVAVVFGSFAIVNAQDGGGRDRRTVAPATDTQHERKSSTTSAPTGSVAPTAATTTTAAAATTPPRKPTAAPAGAATCQGVPGGQTRLSFVVELPNDVEQLQVKLDGAVLSQMPPNQVVQRQFGSSLVLAQGEHTVYVSGKVRNGPEQPNGGGYQLDMYEASTRINLTECEQSMSVVLALAPPPMRTVTVELPHDFTLGSPFGRGPHHIIWNSGDLPSGFDSGTPCTRSVPEYPAVCAGYAGPGELSGRPTATSIALRLPSGQAIVNDFYLGVDPAAMLWVGVPAGSGDVVLDGTMRVHGSTSPARAGHTLHLNWGSPDPGLGSVDLVAIVAADGTFNFGYPPVHGIWGLQTTTRKIIDIDDPGAGTLATFTQHPGDVTLSF